MDIPSVECLFLSNISYHFRITHQHLFFVWLGHLFMENNFNSWPLKTVSLSIIWNIQKVVWPMAFTRTTGLGLGRKSLAGIRRIRMTKMAAGGMDKWDCGGGWIFKFIYYPIMAHHNIYYFQDLVFIRSVSWGFGIIPLVPTTIQGFCKIRNFPKGVFLTKGRISMYDQNHVP